MRLPFVTDFANSVKPGFSFLTQEHDYALVHESSAFDDGALIYESPRLRIRVTRERGQTSFAVRARGDYRDYDAEILAHLLDGATEYSMQNRAPAFTTDAAAGFLRAHLAKIEELFAP